MVTGNAGFIGSNLVDQLIHRGYGVVGIDNLSTGDKDFINPKVDFIYGDIQDELMWGHIPPVDTVFHVAALPRVQASINEPIKTHKANVNGTLNVLEYCRKNKAKLVFSSSSSVYEGDILPTPENAPLKPVSPYALQKQIGEQYIQIYGDLYGLDWAILRYFNVYGERQPLEGSAYATVMGIFLTRKALGLPLQITSDGEQRRDFTYVGDVVEANILASGWNGIYNIGNGDNRSVNQIAKLIGGKHEYIPPRLGEVRHTLADNSKARAKGWRPTISVEEWLNGKLEQG